MTININSMFCSNCGAQLPDGAQFCSECGNSIANKAPQFPQVNRSANIGMARSKAIGLCLLAYIFSFLSSIITMCIAANCFGVVSSIIDVVIWVSAIRLLENHGNIASGLKQWAYTAEFSLLALSIISFVGNDSFASSMIALVMFMMALVTSAGQCVIIIKSYSGRFKTYAVVQLVMLLPVLIMSPFGESLIFDVVVIFSDIILYCILANALIEKQGIE